ncbi:2-hydroxyacid dehydrogenase [Amycolatopsis sp. 195334CR]|uniref:2-hydroxyacid dehydrogenase n=1 Tax=Amycolatopsis sp. 195334CR TaxID=2814588 RepID=UPI001A8C5580|nr:2-hydroxyacid dehydrogenase [Amycolatopsis sp. 195334CR]MBN6033320.1 2-hydroxyacid dehydrogenase [Amycolatopsis sp. 195334CR]
MTSRVLVPWADLGELPAGLRVEVYDGVSAPPADLSDVDFYVLPYDQGVEPVRLMARMPALRAVQTLSAGVDTILPFLPEGVLLANGAGLHDLSVAEHALALVLAAQRDLPRWFRQQGEGSWAREHTRSLADSRVLLLGYGSIGKAIERFLHAAEATVVPVASRARAGVHGVDELASLLPGTDILISVLPGSPSTQGLIGARELALLPDDALVVNVGRGSTMDTAALTTETTTGRLRAALDVLDPEPLPSDHPLWTTPGVIITPHVAGGSASFYPRAKALISAQLHRYAAGEPLAHQVT